MFYPAKESIFRLNSGYYALFNNLYLDYFLSLQTWMEKETGINHRPRRVKEVRIDKALKGEVSRKFGVVSKASKRFVINRNLNVLLKFVVNYHPSVLRQPMSVCGYRWTGLKWTATWKTLGLTVFNFSRFRSQNALEQAMSCPFQEFSWFLFLDIIQLFCN